MTGSLILRYLQPIGSLLSHTLQNKSTMHVLPVSSRHSLGGLSFRLTLHYEQCTQSRTHKQSYGQEVQNELQYLPDMQSVCGRPDKSTHFGCPDTQRTSLAFDAEYISHIPSIYIYILSVDIHSICTCGNWRLSIIRLILLQMAGAADEVVILLAYNKYNKVETVRMSEDLHMIHQVTTKLQESLAEINKMLETYLAKHPKPHQPPKKQSKLQVPPPQPAQEEKKTATKLKRPPGPYIMFCNDQRNLIKEIYPAMSTTEIGEVLGKLWNDLASSEKQDYKHKTEKLLAEFYEKHPEEKHKKRQKKKSHKQ